MKILGKIGLWVVVGSISVSCSLDPYYVGGGQSSFTSFGYGRGYGNQGFTTSHFVSTGDPRWAYDPFAGCYFDYRRSLYYDPFLFGYYPVGYRPTYVFGAPHPGGWNRGRGFCPPPARIRTHNIRNCERRAEQYRSLGEDWSRNVRVSAPLGLESRDNRDELPPSPGVPMSRPMRPTRPEMNESFPSRPSRVEQAEPEYHQGSESGDHIPVNAPEPSREIPIEPEQQNAPEPTPAPSPEPVLMESVPSE